MADELALVRHEKQKTVTFEMDVETAICAMWDFKLCSAEIV